MGHKQTLILLKIHFEMVENYNFKAKWPILTIFRKNANKWGYKSLCILKLNLHLQFLQHYIVEVQQNISSYWPIYFFQNLFGIPNKI